MEGSEGSVAVEEESKEAERREANYRKMGEILEMFGTEEARQRFLDTARAYYLSYRAQRLSKLAGAIQEAERARANLHNRVIDTLQRLSLSPQINPEQESLLRSLADRDVVNEMINDYFDVEIEFRHPRITKLGRMRKGHFETSE